jgi:hypothetical protein
LAKNHHTDDPEKGVNKPGGLQKGQQFQNATNKF